jgi:S-adenosylmethionine decarboxylase
MLTLAGCSPSVLDDEAVLKQLARRAVAATGAQVLQVISHHFDPQGVTILVMLSESHASLHTYPETGTVFWDCFTCGWHCDPEKSVETLVDALNPTSVQSDCMVRGDVESYAGEKTPGGLRCSQATG